MEHTFTFLSPQDLEALKDQPQSIAQKAQTKIDELLASLETLKAEKDAETINHDQLIHQIEQQRSNLVQENEKVKKENEYLRKEIDSLSMYLNYN